MAEKRLTDRAFGLAFATIFGVIAVLGWQFGSGVPLWAATTSAGLLLLALISPDLLMPLNRIWTRLALLIGYVTNHVLLGGFFYVMIIPFGLGARLFGMRSILKRPDPRVDSYWTVVERQAGADTYSDMF